MEFDLQSARFSTNFLEDAAVPDSSDKQPHTSTTTNPFRSETPPPESASPELDPTFDFASNLETHDSVSSLDQIGSPDDSSPSHNEMSPTINDVSPPNGDSTVTEMTLVTEIEQPEEEKAGPVTVVARTSDHWEKFGENGLTTPSAEAEASMTKEDEQNTANGEAKSGEQDKTGV